ncbi:DUF3226 domain-containing protein [Arcicella sp. DC2W]|uniref:DUF3226 domain-containing protein n=1 Tax=Arcicella gelida TaxID=2984195 RepID=A0ABU5SBA1_9BACT|nr:DUF3226 domain-containing protein [Arcicella sp. DC2W]MEA5405762.1 DUF3226 domain-containing protein [Arcicella sp. DC2W]
MKKVQIFVEGIADAKFLKDFVAHTYKIDLEIGKVGSESANPAILIIGGKDKIPKVSNLFKENEINEIANIVIFDADNFAEENSKFVQYQTKYTIESYFLLPNNQDDGDLETLLEQIINREHQTIFDCWASYEECLRSHKEKNYTIPARKTKIYAYLEALLGESKNQKKKIKEAERDYSNTSHWHLNAPALKNLKTFLDKFFIE